MLKRSQYFTATERIQMILNREIARDPDSGDVLKKSEGYSRTGAAHSFYLVDAQGQYSKIKARSVDEAISKATSVLAKAR